MSSYHHSQPPNRYERWDHKDDSYYKMPQPQPSYYEHYAAPPTPRYNILPTPTPTTRIRSRQRWPPSPSVEDEVISLSREATPVLPELVGGEAQMRGSVDQLPIIVEAIPGAFPIAAPRRTENKSPDQSSLKSKSSNESFGPHTPTDSGSINSDRRYVWQPKGDAKSPGPSRRPRPNSLEKRREERLESQRANHGRYTSPLDTRRRTENNVPLPKTTRDTSPYPYSAVPSKPNFFDEHIMSPQMLTPDTKFQRDARGHFHSASQESARQHRSWSSSPAADRPNVVRHASAAAYPGQPMATSPGYKSPLTTPMTGTSWQSMKVEVSSDESDISPDEKKRKSHRSRSMRSSTRPDHLRQSSDISRQEALRLGQRDQYIRSPRPITPPHRPTSNSRGGESMRDPMAGHFNLDAAAPPIKSTVRKPSSSPRPLRNVSPNSTPPPSPRADLNRQSNTWPASTGRRNAYSRPASPAPLAAPPSRKARPDSRHGSRPDSPTQSTPAKGSRPPSLQLSDESNFHRLSASDASKARQSSPQPSPIPEYPKIKPVRIDVQSPSPARARSSTQSSEIPVRPRDRDSSSTFPLLSPQPPSLGLPRVGRSSSKGETARPDAEFLRRPVEIPSLMKSPAKKPPPSPGLPLQLPACPRSEFSTGYSDWSTIPGSPLFDVCPLCRRGIEDMGYTGKFLPSVPRPQGYEIRCDLSIPWVRMAWLLVLQKKAPINVVHDAMGALAAEPPCPGKLGGVRNWYRVHDPDTGKLVSSFDICPSCTRNIETILPNLKGVFRPHASSSSSAAKRTCDLRTDSVRFPIYVDLLEDISMQAAYYRRAPNMLRFVALAKEMSLLRECLRDDQLRNAPWHYIPHLPEFTACEECFQVVVQPKITAGSEIAAAFNRSLRFLPPGVGVPAGGQGVSCQLYSQRMRDVFEMACRSGDFAALRAHVLTRVGVERDLQGRLARAAGLPDQVRVKEVEGLVEEWKRWE